MRNYLLISGIVFGIVALVHADRLIEKWPIQLGSWNVPMWISVVGLIGTGALSYWALRAAGSASR